MMEGWRTDRFTPAGRALAASTLLFFMGVHAFALWLAKAVTHAAGSAQDHFAYRDLIYLLRMSHQHLFGHGVMYFIAGMFFLATPVRERTKAWIVPLPFIGAGLDLAAWWMLKYASSDMEWLSAAGGLLFTASFLGMALTTLWSLAKTKRP
jgi:hypothetical protein